jgi:tRNA modification GTPase
MGVYAAAMTGRGTGPISTIQITGDSALSIIKKVFKPVGAEPAKFETGQILLGTIEDGFDVIDQVTIGCEGQENFAINCHGNPLIVEMIMKLLQDQGVELLSTDQLLLKILTEQKNLNTIEVEAQLAQPKAKTLEGTKIILNQIRTGLNHTAQNQLDNMDEISLDEIQNQALKILQKSHIAKLIIYGVKAVLVGPPNTGKSTLMNYLAGRQKSIVTEIKGTTRDWVEAECKIDSLLLILTDTAGLSRELLNHNNEVENAAQERSLQILENINLVLLVLDNNQPENQLDKQFIEILADKKVLTILNKSDLPVKFDSSKLPEAVSNTVQISAKLGTGIENLKKMILKTCEVTDFNLKQPVCFTDRQEKLLEQLSITKSRQHAGSIIAELLNGQISV